MSETPSFLPRLFAEMKRRRVFRIMAVYGIVGFIVLQVVDLAVPALLLPDWTYRLVALILLVGFPVAIVLAWAFEQTSDGLKRTERADPAEIEAIVAQPASRRWPAGLLALAGVFLLFGGWWLGRQGPGPELNLAISQAQASDFEKIAVLPFENVGSEERDGDIASGIHMDLQQQLGQLSALRVTSPMSVREYRTTDKGDREIAGELDVTYLLRGTVRRSGAMARIDVLLVDAESGANVWSGQYDREITPDNLWDIQSGIALAVARQLARELSPADLAMLEEEPPTKNTAALAAYGRARDMYHRPGAGETLAGAVFFARRAVELDPDFAEAWALLARMLALQAFRGEPVGDAALEAVNTTEALVPRSVEAIVARAFYTYYVEQRFEDALEQLEEAERFAPSDYEVHEMMAYLSRRLGRWDEALSRIRRAIELNPRDPVLVQEYSALLSGLGRYAASDEVMERALQLGPSSPGIRAGKVLTTFRRTGDSVRARGLAAELGLDVAEYPEARALHYMAMYAGDVDEAIRISDQMSKQDSKIGEADRLWRRAWARQVAGRDTKAIADSLLAVDYDSTADSWDEMIDFLVYALMGDDDRAWPMLEESLRIASSQDDVVLHASQLSNAAELSALFGRPERAFDFLDEAVEMHGSGLSVARLQASPSFDTIRDDPRFHRILERRRAYEENAAREAEADRPWLP